MSEREWRFYINDILVFAEKVQAYSAALNQQKFEADELRYDAILRNLELIDEAASHVPEDVRKNFPSIPWRQMIATRNRLIHGYLGIDSDTIWSIIESDIPALIPPLRQMQVNGHSDPITE